MQDEIACEVLASRLLCGVALLHCDRCGLTKLEGVSGRSKYHACGGSWRLASARGPFLRLLIGRQLALHPGPHEVRAGRP